MHFSCLVIHTIRATALTFLNSAIKQGAEVRVGASSNPATLKDAVKTKRSARRKISAQVVLHGATKCIYQGLSTHFYAQECTHAWGPLEAFK